MIVINFQVGEFKPFVPLIAALRQPGMRARHWDQLTAELKMDMHFSEEFTLRKGLEMGLMNNLDVISNVADVASKEFGIETALTKMEADWKNLEMQVLVISYSSIDAQNLFLVTVQAQTGYSL